MTPELTQKLARVRALLNSHIEEAEKATPGPWVYDPDNKLGKIVYHNAPQLVWTSKGPGYGTVADTSPHSLPYPGGQQAIDAAFIASARTLSPLVCKAILLALDEIEAVADSDCEPNGYTKDRLEKIANLFADYPYTP